MTFPKYEAYKDSGVEWLGEVPEHWGMRALRRVISMPLSNGIFKKKEDFGEGTLLINVFDIYRPDFKVDFESLDRVRCTGQEVDAYLVLPGDLLFVRSSLKQEGIAAVAMAVSCPEDLVYECHLIRARPDKKLFNGRFGSYVLNSVVYRSTLIAKSKITTMTTIDQESILSISLPVPPVSEQIQIARFLDHETARIDTLISEQRRLIELLKEKRQTVISHAVTKGLDPTVPMKDSGVEWLGEVPVHWDIKKVAYVCEIHNNLRTPIDRDIRAKKSGPYPYYGPTGILDYIDEFHVEGEYFLLGEDGDHFLKFNEKSMTFRVNGKFCVNNHAHLLRGKENCSTDWAALCFETRDLSPWLIKQGVARYKLRKEILANILMAVPPLAEQAEILEHINLKKIASNRAISQSEESIKLLQERRSALISAAVTGKIDVRGWQAPASTSPAPTPEAAYG